MMLVSGDLDSKEMEKEEEEAARSLHEQSCGKTNKELL